MARPLVVMAGLDPAIQQERMRFFSGSPAQDRWWHRRCDRPLRLKGEIYFSL